MKLVVLSYLAVLRQLFTGELTEEMLTEAVIYLDAPRAYALDPTTIYEGKPDNLLDVVTRNKSKQLEILQIVRKAVRKAEKERRIAWPETHFANSYDQFTSLLARNGLYLPGIGEIQAKWSPEYIDALAKKASARMKILWI